MQGDLIHLLKGFDERELAFFYKLKLPTLSKEDQQKAKTYILARVTEGDIEMHVGRSRIPGLKNCRKCSSKRFETNINNDKICLVCGKKKSKNVVLIALTFLFDLFTMGAN